MHSQMEYLNPWGTKLSWDQKASVIIDPNCHEKQRNYKLVPINHVKRKYVNKYWTWRWGKQQIRLERFKTMRRMEMLLAAIIAILLVLLVLLVSLGCFSWEWYLITSEVYIAGSEIRLKGSSLDPVEELIGATGINFYIKVEECSAGQKAVEKAGEKANGRTWHS